MKTPFASLFIASTMALAPMSFAEDAPNPDLEFETARAVSYTHLTLPTSNGV